MEKERIVGLTVRQPWASLIAMLFKKDEIRKWKTNYRGLVALHVGVNFTAYEKSVCQQEPVLSALREANLFDPTISVRGRPDFSCLPFGAFIATMRITDCLPVDSHEQTALVERAIGEDITGQYSFALTDVKPFPKPIPYRKGFLGFWEIPASLSDEILSFANTEKNNSNP